MGKARLEAFTDGVIAVIITIMVLELKVPHGADVASIVPLLPVFLAYVLSFVFVGMYWNNHHHLLHAVQHIDGRTLWANLHFMFWLSLVPFVTAWMSENHFAPLPVALYGADLLMAGFAYFLLGRILVRRHGRDSTLAHALGRDGKAILSLAIYGAAIASSFWNVWLACGLYLVVAIVWFIPDSRSERYVMR
jgi:uncharacterized membrane protein